MVADALATRVDDRRPRIVVKDVHRAIAQLLDTLHPEHRPAAGVHPTAVIGAGSELAGDVVVEPYVVIGERVRVGAGAWIGAHTVIGDDCRIGPQTRTHAHVTLYSKVQLGARCIVHSGARLGSDGFGYAFVDGQHRKVPQVGGLIIGDDVEIGANTTIDRGSVGPTEIGNGVKIDNLVHLGHNVRVGDLSIIVAQVGVSGSTVLGRGVTLAGQAGVPGHLHIGDRATIAAKSAPFGDVPAGATVGGYPAVPHKVFLRTQAALLKLPELLKRVRALEKQPKSAEE